MHFRTPEQQFAAAMAATPQSPYPRRPVHQPAASWWPDVEPEGDMEDMLAEHSTYRAFNGSVA